MTILSFQTPFDFNSFMKSVPLKLPAIFNQTNPTSPFQRSPLEPDSMAHINYLKDNNLQSIPPVNTFRVEVIVLTIAVVALFMIGFYNNNKGIFKKTMMIERKVEEEMADSDPTEPEPIISEEKSKFPVNIYILEDKRQKVINAPANAIFIYA